MVVSSEEAKNWVTVLAIFAGGIWGIFEYYDVKAERNTSQLEATAALNPRVATSIFAEVIGHNGPSRSYTASLPECSLSEAGRIRTVPLETRITLRVESLMSTTVRVAVSEILVSRMRATRDQRDEISSTEISSSIREPKHFQVQDQHFLSGRSDLVLEPGEVNSFYFSGYIPFNFDCVTSNSTFGAADEFAISAIFQMVADHAGRQISGDGSHVAFTVCTVSYSSPRSCAGWLSDGEDDEPSLAAAFPPWTPDWDVLRQGAMQSGQRNTATVTQRGLDGGAFIIQGE